MQEFDQYDETANGFEDEIQENFSKNHQVKPFQKGIHFCELFPPRSVRGVSAAGRYICQGFVGLFRGIFLLLAGQVELPPATAGLGFGQGGLL